MEFQAFDIWFCKGFFSKDQSKARNEIIENIGIYKWKINFDDNEIEIPIGYEMKFRSLVKHVKKEQAMKIEK